MQSYVGGSTRLMQSVSVRRQRSRCNAEGLPPLPSLGDWSSVQPGALFNLSEAISSDTASAISSSADAIAGAVSSTGVDAAAASSIPPELMALGAVGLAAVAAIGALAANKTGDSEASGTSKVKRAPPPRKNAVIVFGSTGKAGKQVVKALLAAGRTVIAASRAAKPDTDTWAELGVREGEQESGGGILFFENGVDITKAATLKKELFKGVTQAVIACGPVLRTDGKGFEEGLTPEDVDAKGVSNVVKAAAASLPRPQYVNTPLMQASDFGKWVEKNDVIMGGKSSSALTVADGSEVAEWAGELVMEGGGFCGTASPEDDLDLADYDGIALRVKGGGETYKFNIKTADQADQPVQAYQATFDTEPGDWVNVRLPWHAFTPVKMASWNPDAPPLDPSKIRSVGLVYSRFDLNGIANPNYRPGAFKLEVEGGMSAYTAPKPAVALITSAAVERNAVIGDDAAARAADIPIVQLNPAGSLNWKYKGEAALRESGVSYSIIRPTGLIRSSDPDDGKAYTLEFSQGDVIAGRVSREEVADVVTAALQEPAAAGATFELRRTERWSVGGPATFDAAAAKVEFLKLVKDTERRRAGLRPMPAWVPPPEPVPEERVKEILADPRVQEEQNRDKSAPEAEAKKAEEPKAEEAEEPKAEEPKAEEPKAEEAEKPKAEAPKAEKAEAEAPKVDKATATSGAASLALRQASVSQWVADYRSRTSEREAAAAPQPAPPSEEDIAANKAAVDKWIAEWRAKAPQPEPTPAEPAASAPSAAAVEQQQAEVQAWIDAWRSRPPPSNGAASSNGASQVAEVEEWIAKWRSKNMATK